VLFDFGAARQRLGEKSLTVVESPGYTPFEQLQSRGNVGPWSDLYALGSTVFKLLTGEAPPKAMDRMPDDSYFPLAARNELVTHYGRELLSSIDRALAVRLAERWQSAGEWRVALQGRERPILPSAQTVQVRNEPPLKTPADKIEPVKSPLAEEAVVQVVTTPGVQRNPKDVVYPWDKAHVGFACPHCRVPLRVQMQFLRAPVFNCGSCGRQIVPKRLSQVSSTEPDVQYNWDLFHWLCSYDARIGRRDFWLLVILPCALLPIFYYVENEILAVAGWFVFITWLFLCFVQATIRRLHDLDHRGNWLWLCLLAFIPPSSAMVIFLGLFIVLLGLVPGKNRPNRFGPPISQMRGPLDRWLFRRAEH
jgi:uncharacterized membrane protein YhaH (DUF805 family)